MIGGFKHLFVFSVSGSEPLFGGRITHLTKHHMLNHQFKLGCLLSLGFLVYVTDL